MRAYLFDSINLCSMRLLRRLCSSQWRNRYVFAGLFHCERSVAISFFGQEW